MKLSTILLTSPLVSFVITKLLTITQKITPDNADGFLIVWALVLLFYISVALQFNN